VKFCLRNERPVSYREFIKTAGLVGRKTPDGVRWNGRKLCDAELDADLRQMVASEALAEQEGK
jgi:hypothetical protein